VLLEGEFYLGNERKKRRGEEEELARKRKENGRKGGVPTVREVARLAT